MLTVTAIFLKRRRRKRLLIAAILRRWLIFLIRLSVRSEYILWHGWARAKGLLQLIGRIALGGAGSAAGLCAMLYVLCNASRIDTMLGAEPSSILLNTAVILATMYTLSASISVIPLQRAAESLTPSVVQLFRRDGVFAFVLATISIVCVLVTTAVAPIFGLRPHQELAAAIFVLGSSLDLIKWYVRHVAYLLNPKTAVDRLKLISLRMLRNQGRQARTSARFVRRLDRRKYSRDDVLRFKRKLFNDGYYYGLKAVIYAFSAQLNKQFVRLRAVCIQICAGNRNSAFKVC